MKQFKKKEIIICSVLLIIFFLVFGVVFLDKNLVIDEAIYNFIMKSRCTFLDNYFTFITRLGDPITVVIVVIVTCLILRNKDIIYVLSSAAASIGFNTIIKQLVRRSRPEHLRLVVEKGFSFPSGHAMISICVYGVILYLIICNIKNKYLKYTLATLVGILILSIGISRIYVGVHYPTDVLAGYSLSIVIIIVINRLRGKINV